MVLAPEGSVPLLLGLETAKYTIVAVTSTAVLNRRLQYLSTVGYKIDHQVKIVVANNVSEGHLELIIYISISTCL